MSDHLPDPLVPAEVDLRDFGFMPLHVSRLRDSELADLATGDEFKAAVLLWCYAWHQVPAASLPNDDRILAARSGAGALWRKVKDMALRGFVACSDGRLYHPLIAEAAADAWARREVHQETRANKETRQQRWRAELARLSGLLRDAGVTPPERPTKRALVDMCRLHVPGFVDASVDGDVDAVDVARETGSRLGETARTGTGTGTGTETETNTRGRAVLPPPLRAPVAEPPGPPDAESPAAAHPATPPGPPEPPPEAGGHPPTPAGLACRAMRQAGLQGTNPADPRLHVLLDRGVTPGELVGVAAEAVAKGRGWPWVLATAKGRRDDADGMAQASGPAPTPRPQEPAAARPETDQERYEREDRERRAMTPEQLASNRAARDKAIALARSVLSITPRRAAGGEV